MTNDTLDALSDGEINECFAVEVRRQGLSDLKYWSVASIPGAAIAGLGCAAINWFAGKDVSAGFAGGCIGILVTFPALGLAQFCAALIRARIASKPTL